MESKHKTRSYSNNELVRRKIVEHVRYTSLGSNKGAKEAADQGVKDKMSGIRTSPSSPAAKIRQQKPNFSRSIDTEIGMSNETTVTFLDCVTELNAENYPFAIETEIST